MSWDLFQKIIFSSALDAKKEVQIIGRMGHGIDHPFHLSHPEGEYLRGFALRVL
jgi:23S rRNA (cytosine1962-C5)-methyltransferase